MNQSIRRGTTAGVAAVLSAAALALSACGSSSDSADESSGDGLGDVTVQFSWIKNAEFAGEFIADSAGYYKDAGLGKATFLAGPVAQEEIVATGKADFGLSNAVSTASAITNSDFPLKIIGATYQKNPFSILSLADQGNIKTPQDLIGKKIGVQDPNLSLFKAFLAANDIDEKDVEIVPNGFDVAPLEDKQIDGLVAYVTNCWSRATASTPSTSPSPTTTCRSSPRASSRPTRRWRRSPTTSRRSSRPRSRAGRTPATARPGTRRARSSPSTPTARTSTRRSSSTRRSPRPSSSASCSSTPTRPPRTASSRSATTSCRPT